MQKKIFIILTLIFIPLISLAQDELILNPTFRWDGEIYCEEGYDLEEGYCIKVTPRESSEIKPTFRWNGEMYCEEGYELNYEGKCEKIKETAPLEDGLCPPGFLKLNNQCINEKKDCPYGYKKQGYSCVQIFLPYNAYYIDNGHDWQCDYGYKKEGQKCIEIKLPAHAHYTNKQGTIWSCDYGYKLINQTTCVKVFIPNHAIITSSDGISWECEYGYKKDGNSCKYINVPVNAHLTNSGHSWACDTGYKNMGSYCQKENLFQSWTKSFISRLSRIF